MKNNNQDTIEKRGPEAKNVEAENVQTSGVSEEESIEVLYAKERKKNQALLISTAVFAALFLISVAFGLRATGQSDDTRDTMRPGGMMQGNFDGRRGPSSQYYR